MITKEIRARVENYLEIDLNRRGENNRHIRSPRYTMARAVYYQLCRKYTTLSLQSIGDTLDQDHATVLNSIKNIFPNLVFWKEKQYMEVYQDVCDEIEPIKARLKKEAKEARDYVALLDENAELKMLLDSALRELNNEDNYIQKYIMAKTQLGYLTSVITKKKSLATAEQFIQQLKEVKEE